MHPEQPTDTGALDAETLAFAFELARNGRADEPAAYGHPDTAVAPLETLPRRRLA